MDRLISRTDLQGWLPIRMPFRQAEIMVDWAFFGKQKFTEPFFRDTVSVALRLPFNQAFRRETTADEMVAWTEKNISITPTAFIFHASRCGSTLIGQMLATLPSHIVMSEPPMLDTILRAKYYLPELTEAKQIAYVRALVLAMAEARNGESQFVIKVDAWDIFELPLLRKAFPDTPWIFLYRDPLEIAVSQLRQRGAYLVPGVLGLSQLTMSQDEALAMSEEEYIARMLGMMLQQAALMLSQFGGTAVHYQQLPVAMWTTLRSMFGVTDHADSVTTLQRAAAWDAKNPFMEFVHDSGSKQREASSKLRGYIEQWAAPPYQLLENMRNSA